MSELYPDLVELISRLKGKDRKTCELALHCLLTAERRDKRLRDRAESIVAANEKLRAALKPFADAYDDCRFEYSAALFKSSDLCAAVAAIRETNDGNDHKNRPTDPVDNSQRVSLRTLPD